LGLEVEFDFQIDTNGIFLANFFSKNHQSIHHFPKNMLSLATKIAYGLELIKNGFLFGSESTRRNLFEDSQKA
jgi:hypothetical protein